MPQKDLAAGHLPGGKRPVYCRGVSRLCRGTSLPRRDVHTGASAETIGKWDDDDDGDGDDKKRLKVCLLILSPLLQTTGRQLRPAGGGLLKIGCERRFTGPQEGGIADVSV